MRASKEPSILTRTVSVLGAAVFLAATAHAQSVRMIADIHPGPTGSNFSEFKQLGNGIVFHVDQATPALGNAIAVSDAERNGTRVLVTTNGPSSSVFFALPPVPLVGDRPLTLKQASFQGYGLTSHSPINGSPSAFAPQVYIGNGGYSYHATSGGITYMALAPQSRYGGNPLLRTDGTTSGTFILQSTSIPQRLVDVNGTLVFMQGDTFQATSGLLLATNGTADTTRQIAVLNGASLASTPAHVWGSRLYFANADPETGRELWMWNADSDLPAAPIVDLSPGSASTYIYGIAARTNGEAYFLASTPTVPAGLWLTDGTPGGTRLLMRLPGGETTTRFNGSTLITDGDRAYFVFPTPFVGPFVPFATWVSGGTPESTRILQTLPVEVRVDGFYSPLALIQTTLCLRATTPALGEELWLISTDGTSPPRPMDLSPGTAPSWPYNFLAVNSRMYFTANDGTHGNELWAINACPGDFNNDGVAATQDIFDYINAYLTLDPRADVNTQPGITLDDLFTFLTSYFAGCE